MTTNQVFTTADLATAFGVTEGSIRNHKTRKAEQLTENVHWFSQEGKTFWTVEGAKLLAEWTSTQGAADFLQALSSDPTGQLAASSAQTIASDSADDAVDPMMVLDAAADEIAWGLIQQRLPRAVAASIRRILSNPTEQDQQRLQDIFRAFGIVTSSGILSEAVQRSVEASQQAMHQLEGSEDSI